MSPSKAAASARKGRAKAATEQHAGSSGRAATREQRIANLAPFRFKPGQSGNPSGRAKRDFAAEIAQAIFEKNPDEVYRAMLKALRRGSPQAFAALAERGYGKTPQHIEVDGQVAASVTVRFENVAASAES